LTYRIKKETPKKATPKKEVKKEVKKEAKKEVKKETKRVKKEEKDEKDGKDGKKRKKKEEEEEVYKWWLEPPLPEGKKWKTLQHNGVLFPPPYEPHGVKMLYDGQPVDLTPEQEEIATFYAQYIETDHVQKPQFKKNFFEEFLAVLNPKKKGEVFQLLDLLLTFWRNTSLRN
jgi:DNA topoisomerase-1